MNGAINRLDTLLVEYADLSAQVSFNRGSAHSAIWQIFTMFVV